MPFTPDIAVPSTPQPMPHSNASEVRNGDFETLFQMLEELGPAPEAFMIGLDDPVLDAENVFELEADS